jgi:flavin-dependent dehydrogenase
MSVAAARYDALVVGARCAGAATAMLLARAGARVLMVDWDQPGTDTLSTHALMRGGVMQLRAWGLLDRIVAAGTPAVRRTEFRYGDEVVGIDVKPSYGVDALYAPRRTVLDRVLVEAAVDAGVEARFGAGLATVRRDAAGRVCGAMLNVGQEAMVPVEAGIVIGADGRRSTTARRVGARTLRLSAHAASGVYAYVEGIPVPGYVWGYREGLAAGSIATNDGLHCVFANLPPEAFMAGARGRLDAALAERVAEVVPELGAAMAAGRVRVRAVAFAGQKGHLLEATGPGWALVGDAGYFKDPITAHGINDALRDAEILARAVSVGSDAALADFGRLRDALSTELYEVTDAIASFRWTLAELQEMHIRLNRAMKAEQDWMLEVFGHEAEAA